MRLRKDSMKKSKLKAFLQSRALEYRAIDKFRAFRMYEKYKKHFKLNYTIQIVGTNGKGSTGRFLAQMLANLGFNVGHFSSPHLFKFNERFFYKKRVAKDSELESAHSELEAILGKDLQKLSYFEYATFLAAILFKNCDFVILEAGLGGEYDATSVFKRKLSVFTRIDFDHTELLGDSLEKIARTKLKTMAKKAIISSKQESEVLSLACKIALLKNVNLAFDDELLSSSFKKEISNFIKKKNYANFLEQNLSLAVAALLKIVSKNEALRALKKLEKLDLKGRLEQISKNLFIDVGHNENAASAILEHFKGQKINLIYNSFLDKDIFQILSKLKPIIDKIMICEYESQRELAGQKIAEFALKLGIESENFKGLEAGKTHLVFGSFLLVENFLNHGLK